MNKKKDLLQAVLWILEGIIVGFGAIMPGVSGGTLCASFGMYKPIMEIVAHPIENFKKYFRMLAFFVVGAVVGFVGLSGFAGWLMEINSVAVTCAFIGFIIGTFPELWCDAGEQGRKNSSYAFIIIGFLALITILLLLRSKNVATIAPGIGGYLLCGVLWGLSFIVPGLSSSTLLIFFGLYGPMLDGIGRFDMGVLIPMGIGVMVCVLLLSKAMNIAFKKYYAPLSHAIIGMVAATTIMIFPFDIITNISMFWYVIYIIAGAIVSYTLTRVCAKLKK